MTEGKPDDPNAPAIDAMTLEELRALVTELRTKVESLDREVQRLRQPRADLRRLTQV